MSWNTVLQQRAAQHAGIYAKTINGDAVVAEAGPPTYHGYADGFLSLVSKEYLNWNGDLLGGVSTGASISSGGTISSSHPFRLPQCQIGVIGWDVFCTMPLTGVLPTYSTGSITSMILWVSALSHADLKAAFLRAPIIYPTSSPKVIDRPYGAASDAVAGHVGDVGSWFYAMQHVDPSAVLMRYASIGFIAPPSQWWPTNSHLDGASTKRQWLYSENAFVQNTQMQYVQHDWTLYQQAVAEGMPNVALTEPIGHYIHFAIGQITTDGAAWTAWGGTALSCTLTFNARPGQAVIPGA